MQIKCIAECSKRGLLQYFRPSLSYHLSLRPLFCLFLSGCFTQVLLYAKALDKKNVCLSLSPAQNILQLQNHIFYFSCLPMKQIWIHHESEGRIEKSKPRITDWYREAFQVMTNGGHERQIFLSYPQWPHTNNGFFFLLTTQYLILYWKNMKKTSRKSWIRWDVTLWCNFNITMTSQIGMRPACVCSFFIFLKGWYG